MQCTGVRIAKLLAGRNVKNIAAGHGRDVLVLALVLNSVQFVVAPPSNAAYAARVCQCGVGVHFRTWPPKVLGPTPHAHIARVRARLTALQKAHWRDWHSAFIRLFTMVVSGGGSAGSVPGSSHPPASPPASALGPGNTSSRSETSNISVGDGAINFKFNKTSSYLQTWNGSSLFFYPLELFKTRQQVDRTPASARSFASDSGSHVRGTLREHGWRALFHGFVFATVSSNLSGNTTSYLG